MAPARSSSTSATTAASVDRLFRETEVAAGDRRDERDLVAVLESLVALDVRTVDGVEEPGGLLAEPEGRPDVLDAGSVAKLEVVPARSGALAQAGEEPHRHSHGR